MMAAYMIDDFGNKYVASNGKLEEAIAWAIAEHDQSRIIGVLEELREMAKKDRKLLVPVSKATGHSIVPMIMGFQDKDWVVGYTSMEIMREVNSDEKAYALGVYDFVNCANDYDGVIINPIQGEFFPMDRQIIRIFMDGCGWE